MSLMHMPMFMPQLIQVGFRHYEHAHTGKAVVLTYRNEKGEVENENWWRMWSNEHMKPLEIMNSPTSGFVLNRDTDDSHKEWSSHCTYISVYDPRGFEFSLSVQNLLYIMENSTGMNGKELNDEFVYAWDGGKVILMPVNAPEYAKAFHYQQTIYDPNPFKAKELIKGAIYETKKRDKVVYLGYFNSYHKSSGKCKGKEYFFYNLSAESRSAAYLTTRNAGQLVRALLEEQPHANYEKYINRLQTQPIFSPFDHSKDEYVPYTVEEILKILKIQKESPMVAFLDDSLKMFNDDHVEISIDKCREEHNKYTVGIRNHYEDIMEGSLQEICLHVKPLKLNQYLKNGRLYESLEKNSYKYLFMN